MRGCLRGGAFVVVLGCGPVAPPCPQCPAPVAVAWPVMVVESQEVRETPEERACGTLWATLRAGEVTDVPLATRCRLAAAIGPAAVQILDFARSEWWKSDAEVTKLAVIVPSPTNELQRLLRDDETCERSPAIRTFNKFGADGWPRDMVEVIGALEGPTRADVTLRLGSNPPAEVCAATFSWSMNQSLGTLVPQPPRPPGAGRVPVYRPSIAYFSRPAPRLVVEVVMKLTQEAGSAEDVPEFVVTRAALEG